MLANTERAHNYINGLLRTHSLEELRRRLEPKTDNPSPKVSAGRCLTAERFERHWLMLAAATASR